MELSRIEKISYIKASASERVNIKDGYQKKCLMSAIDFLIKMLTSKDWKADDSVNLSSYKANFIQMCHSSDDFQKESSYKFNEEIRQFANDKFDVIPIMRRDVGHSRCGVYYGMLCIIIETAIFMKDKLPLDSELAKRWKGIYLDAAVNAAIMIFDEAYRKLPTEVRH